MIAKANSGIRSNQALQRFQECDDSDYAQAGQRCQDAMHGRDRETLDDANNQYHLDNRWPELLI
jgi:hypothetical protein